MKRLSIEKIIMDEIIMVSFDEVRSIIKEFARKYATYEDAFRVVTEIGDALWDLVDN